MSEVHIDDAIAKRVAERSRLSADYILSGKVTPESEVDNMIGQIAALEEVQRGRIATDDKLRADELQAELDEIRSMGTHRDRIDGECQCYVCTRDFEGLFEHAAACAIDAFQQKERLEVFMRALAAASKIEAPDEGWVLASGLTVPDWITDLVDEAYAWVKANPEVAS